MIQFSNVNDLPLVPKGHIRELKIEQYRWFYSDTPEWVKTRHTEVDCRHCGGSGVKVHPNGYEVHDCIVCNATGKVDN